MKKALRTALFVSVLCPLLPNTQPAGAATAGSVIRVTLTSSWPTHSPDPMGLTYNPRAKRLLISDSEVDEMPALWKGKSLFVAKRGGSLVTTGTFRRFTLEPEDLAWNNKTQVLFVTDDDRDRVFRVGRGKDRKLGTRDDVAATVLNTRRFGSPDPEGLAWRGGRKPMLIVTDSGDTGPTSVPRVYKILRGKDKRFGTRDDVISSFGTHKYGFTSSEDVAIKGKRLFIVSNRQHYILETDLSGRLIQKIDISSAGIKAASGITFAPGTDGGKGRIYITDSGVDNGVNPSENDGRLFELKLVNVP
jgi:DNA-binding beta-propeller fold protein YncE